MAFATLKVAALDVARNGFPLQLTEADGTRTEGLLSLAELGKGPWTVGLTSATAEAHSPGAPGAAVASPAPAVAGPAGAASPAVGTLPSTDILRAVASATPLQRLESKWADIGRTLFNLLFPNDSLLPRWDALRASRAPLFLQVEDPTLAQLPWELARSTDPALRLGTYLTLTRHAPAASFNTSCSPWPFRILIVVGCTRQEANELNVSRECAQIERVFLPLGRSVDVRILSNPERKQLAEVVKAWHPHVLHFAGHAGQKPGTKEIGLRISRDDGDWYWTPSDVQPDLPEWDWSPAFVFLNACRTAAEVPGVWGMQRAFMSAGVKAVLTLQADVRGDHAGLFAASLYEAIAEGKALEEAAKRAREDLLNETGDTHLDWALPSLVVSEPQMKLFRPLDPVADPEYEDCFEFNEARFYANCRPARRLLTHWFTPARPSGNGTRPRNVLVLTGERSTGKSHLLKWCMESWALSNARVRYLCLHTGEKKGFLEVLRQIRDGDHGGQRKLKYLHDALPAVHFRRFNWELNNLLRDGRPGTWDEAAHPAGVAIADELGTQFPNNGEKRPEPLVCKSFLEALHAVAAERPLILVFDQVGGPKGERLVDPQCFVPLMDHLFRPIAASQDSRVKLVFSVTPQEKTDYAFLRLDDSLCESYTHPYDQTKEELVDLALEMVRHEYPTEVTPLAQAVLGLPVKPGAPQGVARLGIVLHALKLSIPELENRIRRMK
jgi:hypothetical protein